MAKKALDTPRYSGYDGDMEHSMMKNPLYEISSGAVNSTSLSGVPAVPGLFL